MTSVIKFFSTVSTFFVPLSLLFAQKNASDSLLQNLELKEVVVQVTRVSSNSPVPHSNFSSEQLGKQYHAQDVPFLLSAVPSLVETSDAGAGTGYSGLRIRGSDPTRVNITLNGIPVNDAESQGVFWVNMPDLVGSVSEIQVQRGVGTSTNGAGAFGATINLDLSKVESDRFARINQTVGSFGTRRQSIHLGTGLFSSGLAFSARVSNVHSDGFVDRAKADLTGMHVTGAYIGEKQSIQCHLLTGKEITYQAWNGLPAQYLENPQLRTYNSTGTEREGAPYPDEVDHYTQRHFLLHYKQQIAANVLLQVNGHYTRGFGYFEQYKANQTLLDYGLSGDTFFPVSDLVRRRWLDNHFYGGTFALRWIPGGRWKSSVLLGGGWNHYAGAHFGEVIWSEHFTGAQNDYRYYDNEANKKDGNVFLKFEFAPINPLNVFVDFQVRCVNYRFLGYDNELNNVTQSANLLFFNPKMGATWQLSSKWQGFVFGGVGHREPNRDDYTQSTPNSRPKPEQMLDLEMGLRRKKDNGQLAMNLFWMQYLNQLVLDGRINDVGAFIRTNVPDSRRIGLELEVSEQWGSRFSWMGSASLSQNTVKEFQEYIDDWDTGTQETVVHQRTNLAFSPSAICRAEVNWVWWNRSNRVGKGSSFSSTLIGKYVSRQFLDNTSNGMASLPAYTVGDIRLNWTLDHIVGEKLALIFSVNNILDHKYESNGWVYRFISAGYDPRADDPYARLENGDKYHLAGFFPQAGRHWMATVQLSF
ncbi:MAG: TonB-dependent receptor plug domain-containing protein [Saprospiraceae bacterium]|nr:TonB-dependent receptor plug domain-containing protein [Saprospiraceae bacterium]